MSDPSTSYRFRGICFTPSTGSLTKPDGESLQLSPQLSLLLESLIDAGGSLVSREALYDRMWGDQFVDREHGLNFCVRQLRTHLGDDARSPTFIETVRGRGYRFLPGVRRASSGTISDRGQRLIAAARASLTGPPRVRARVVAVAAASILAAGVYTAGELANSERAPGVRDPILQEARYLEEKGTPADLRRAVTRYQTVAASDPRSAEAYEGLARAWTRLALWGVEPRVETFEAARGAALAALQLHPEDASAHISLGIATLYLDLDSRAAGKHFSAAVELSPELGKARLWHARSLAINGETARALEEAETALALDPESVEIMTDMGWFSYLAGDYESAVQRSRRALSLEPRALAALMCMQASHIALGDEAAAREVTERILSTMDAGREPLPNDDGWLVDAAVALEEGCPSRSFSLESARLFAAAGSWEHALELIREGVETRAWWSPYLEIDPAFAGLRAHDRYGRLFAALTSRT